MATLEITPDCASICADHAIALGQSLAQERMGYIPDVEVSGDVVKPYIIGHEQMAAMGIQRGLQNRELARHPDDDNKMIIVAQKIGYTGIR